MDLNIVPEGACDCHAHVFGPLARFPLANGRSYTPPERLPSDYRDMLDRVGLARGVIVQPTVYGTDNRATLAALVELGERVRGVAVLPPDTGDNELSALAASGIRGARINAITPGGTSLNQLEALASRLKGSGWHIQIFADFPERLDLIPRIRRLGVPVVIDHLGALGAECGADDPAFAAIVGLLRDGLCWLKLSGPYIVSRQQFPYADVAPVAGGFVEACPGRLVWASDWPHPLAGEKAPGTAELLALLDRWAPEAAVRKRILVDNPAELYGFNRI
jgi:predicted TIM-barrel fold metal-dependent hydrolase